MYYIYKYLSHNKHKIKIYYYKIYIYTGKPEMKKLKSKNYILVYNFTSNKYFTR